MPVHANSMENKRVEPSEVSHREAGEMITGSHPGKNPFLTTDAFRSCVVMQFQSIHKEKKDAGSGRNDHGF